MFKKSQQATSVSYCRLTIRVNLKLYDRLMQEVGAQGKRLSVVVRELLEQALDVKQRVPQQPQIEKTKIKSLAELLYLCRAISDTVDSNLTQQAYQHGLDVIEKMYGDIPDKNIKSGE